LRFLQCFRSLQAFDLAARFRDGLKRGPQPFDLVGALQDYVAVYRVRVAAPGAKFVGVNSHIRSILSRRAGGGNELLVHQGAGGVNTQS
jgi:hypothetical protein